MRIGGFLDFQSRPHWLKINETYDSSYKKRQNLEILSLNIGLVACYQPGFCVRFSFNVIELAGIG